VIAPNGIDRDALKRADPNGVALLASFLARVGRTADAERTLEVAIPYAANPTGLSDTHHAQFDIGRTYALLGRPDKALEWITKAANEGYPSYPRFSTDPDLVSLKGHPGFAALLERLRKDHERWSKTL
jgi:tetratricopeptide (TPR) repeat protein